LPKAFELEVLLLEKPKKNKVEFTVETKGLKFYYQPELTQKEKDDGAFRPENVVGSYAVYHESKTNNIIYPFDKSGYTLDELNEKVLSEELVAKINKKTSEVEYYTQGKKYRVGKAFHIYRPKIVDSAGTEVWGDLIVDTNKKVLTVEIPQEFLDNAVYPVRHAAGLTFGYTSAGGSNLQVSYYHSSFPSRRRDGNAWAGVNGTATELHAFLKTKVNKNVDTSIFLNIYDSVDGTHEQVVTLEIANLSLTTSYVDKTFNITDSGIFDSNDYTLSISLNDQDLGPTDGTNGYLAFDSTTLQGSIKFLQGNNNSSYDSYTATKEAPWEGKISSYNFCASIYATYTASGGGTNMKINISDAWKDVSKLQINIADSWKDVSKVQLNVGDSWKTIFEP